MVFPCSALILFLSVTQKKSMYGFLYATERNLGLEGLQNKVAVQWTCSKNHFTGLFSLSEEIS